MLCSAIVGRESGGESRNVMLAGHKSSYFRPLSMSTLDHAARIPVRDARTVVATTTPPRPSPIRPRQSREFSERVRPSLTHVNHLQHYLSSSSQLEAAQRLQSSSLHRKPRRRFHSLSPSKSVLLIARRYQREPCRRRRSHLWFVAVVLIWRRTKRHLTLFIRIPTVKGKHLMPMTLIRLCPCSVFSTRPRGHLPGRSLCPATSTIGTSLPSLNPKM